MCEGRERDGIVYQGSLADSIPLPALQPEDGVAHNVERLLSSAEESPPIEVGKTNTNTRGTHRPSSMPQLHGAQ